VQEYLQRGYDVRVTKTSYATIWEGLRESFGDWGAADAVCELAIATAKPRVRKLVEQAECGEAVTLRWDELKILDLLFEYGGEPTELGAYLLDYRKRSAGAGKDVAAATTKTPREKIPDSVKIFVWQRDQGRCVNCGSQERLEFDHIIPIAKGGSNTARNLQLLCERCNRSKGASII
jgi:hypothetical protein